MGREEEPIDIDMERNPWRKNDKYFEKLSEEGMDD